MTRRHVAFVIPHPYVDAIACFREPIKHLADRGWQVDVYTPLSSTHPPPAFNRENVRLVPLEITRGGVIRFIAQVVTHRPRYDWVIAVPQWGLHYAGIAASLARIALVCLSDELFTDGEAATGEQQRWRRREKRAHRKSAFTIALTEERADFVRQENALGPAHRIFVVPNAAPGPPERLPSHYYQDTLGIAADRCVLLHAGSWWWKRGFSEVEDVARRWDDRNVVVFQGRHQRDFPEPAAHPCLRFSANVLPADLLDYAVSSAHIGLALYDTRDANNRLVGLSAGKVTLYMKNALPFVVMEHPSFDWVEREGVGIIVRNLRDLEAAVMDIRGNYDHYVKNVKRYYTEKLDFGRAFAPVIARLEGTEARA